MRTLVAASLLALTAGVLAPTAATADAGRRPRRRPPTRRHSGRRRSRRCGSPVRPAGWRSPGTSSTSATGRSWSPSATPRGCCGSRTATSAGSRFPRSSVWVSGETGLMSLEIDPALRQERPVLHLPGRPHVRRRARRPGRRLAAQRRPDPGPPAPSVLLAGIQATSGRHGGCRLLIGRNGSLLVGTGDAAVEQQPAQPAARSTARCSGSTAAPAPRGRPTPTSTRSNRKQRYVLNYGHRNVQGLATAPRRHRLVGRARLLPRRRGQPRGQRRRLRLEPGPGLRRERPDDRPRASPAAADRGPVEQRRARPSPPPAPPGSAARSGAASTAPSRWPRSRAAGWSS